MSAATAMGCDTGMAQAILDQGRLGYGAILKYVGMCVIYADIFFDAPGARQGHEERTPPSVR